MPPQMLKLYLDETLTEVRGRLHLKMKARDGCLHFCTGQSWYEAPSRPCLRCIRRLFSRRRRHHRCHRCCSQRFVGQIGPSPTSSRRHQHGIRFRYTCPDESHRDGRRLSLQYACAVAALPSDAKRALLHLPDQYTYPFPPTYLHFRLHLIRHHLRPRLPHGLHTSYRAILCKLLILQLVLGVS